MLFNLLPGLREIRAPLISGYLWLTFFFLLLHQELPSRSSPGIALKPLFDIAEDLSVPTVIAITGVVAYLVGSAMQELWKVLGRVVSPRRPLYGEVGIRTSLAGRRDVDSAVRSRIQAVTAQLAQVALSPGEKGIAEAPETSEIEQELPLIRTLLLGERPELVGELDRLQAEADLRITVAFPLAFLAAYLAGGVSPGWLVLLVPALLLLGQGYQRQLEAGDLLAKALKVGKADAPTLEALSSSADAALERIELEAELHRRMDGGDGLAAFQLGNLQASWDDFDSAAISLEFAVEKGIVRAYAELGLAQEKRRDDVRAERAYRDGAQRRDEKARIRLAALLRRLDRAEEARVAERAEGELEEKEHVQPETDRGSEYRKKMEEGDPKAAINLGLLLQRQGKDREAVGALRRATELDSEDPQAWLELANAQFARGLFFDAEGPLERALELQERQLGPTHLEVARTLNFQGMIAHELGHFEKGRELHGRALQIQEDQLGPTHPDVALTRADLANIETEFDEFEASRKKEEEALETLRQTLGPDDQEIARLTGNLGWTYRELGMYERALELTEDALRLEETELDPEGPSVARSLISLGAILEDLGQHAKARTHLERAVRSLRKAGDPNAHHLAEALRELARILTGSDRPDRAIELCEEALEIQTERLGPRHPERALTLVEAGSAYLRDGSARQAQRSLREALGILEEGPKQSAVALCLRILGEALAGSVEGFDAVERAVEIQRQVLPAGHPERARSYESMAAVLEAQRSRDEAAHARAGAESERSL